MKKSLLYVFFGLTTLAFTSCSKDDSAVSDGPEIGTWNFAGAHVVGTVSNETDFGGEIWKTVTESDYTTEDNTGTLTFNGKTAVAENVGYSVDTESDVYTYIDGDLEDSFTMPFTFTLPSYSSVAEYKAIGTDSLYFESGGLLNVNTGDVTESTAGGYKMSISGDNMTLFYASTQAKDYDDGTGGTVHSVTTAEITLSLTRR